LAHLAGAPIVLPTHCRCPSALFQWLPGLSWVNNLHSLSICQKGTAQNRTDHPTGLIAQPMETLMDMVAGAHPLAQTLGTKWDAALSDNQDD